MDPVTAAIRQHKEQTAAAMGELAILVRAYYESLLEQGFSRKDALALTAEYQTAIVTSGIAANTNEDE